MFAILMKDVDGRRYDRYFREFMNAEKTMMQEVKDVTDHYGCAEHTSIDEMNTSKGIYEREEKITDNEGYKYHCINSSNHWMSIRSRFGGFEESSIITLLKAAQSVMSEYIMIKIIVDEDDKGVLFIVDQLSGSINDFKSFFARGMTNLQCAIKDFSNLL